MWQGLVAAPGIPVIQGAFDGNADGNAGALW